MAHVYECRGIVTSAIIGCAYLTRYLIQTDNYAAGDTLIGSSLSESSSVSTQIRLPVFTVLHIAGCIVTSLSGSHSDNHAAVYSYYRYGEREGSKV
jgi:hypothetical protein